MKFSYTWLRQLSGTDKAPEELASFLTMRAFEVEEVSRIGGAPQGVLIGKVLSLDLHPNADRLRIARVSLGKGNERVIVCGAPNLAKGHTVAVALPGVLLPGDITIQETVIRGIRSEGMICSEKELGLGPDHKGILVLSDSLEEGSALTDAFPVDWSLDVKILPDRSHDCLAHVGLAREIAALEGREFDYAYSELTLDRIDDSPFSIVCETEGESRRYIGALVRNITLGTSPSWVVDRLKIAGIRSINSVVDATNMVMLELGQPLHAFDWDTLSELEGTKNIGPRFARTGERFSALDGKVYELSDRDIVISDGERILALGGIIGGSDSAVSERTHNVFFEAAHFDPTVIRRTRTRLGIESDASFRFEKGISPDLPERAMVRLLEIVRQIAGGDVQGVVDNYKEQPPIPEVSCSVKSITDLLGTNVEPEEMGRLLKLREFNVTRKKDILDVIPPPYRLDVVSVADVAEEIGKGIGYDRILANAPIVSLSAPTPDPILGFLDDIQDSFVSLGYAEAYNYSFYSERDAHAAQLDIGVHCALENPMNPDQALVRTTLLPGLLRNVSTNIRNFAEIRLFESGKVSEKLVGSVRESLRLGGSLSSQNDNGDLFYQVKAAVIHALTPSRIAIDFRPRVSESEYSPWHPTRSVDMIARNAKKEMVIGTLGEILPSVLRSFGISKRVACFEFDCRVALDCQSSEPLFTPLRRYPETLRDLSCFVPDRTTVADVERIIRSVGGNIVSGIQLFDRYQDVDRGRSLAFHVRLAKESETVSREEADDIMLRISDAIAMELGGGVRRK